ELDSTVAHAGKRSYRLRGDFTGGGGYVGTERVMPVLGGADVKELRVWIKSTNVGSLGVRFIDRTHQCHQKYVALPPGPEWQEIVLKIPEVVGGEHWGGAND